MTSISRYNELNACIKRLNYLKSTVTRPFFMEVFRMQAEQQLSNNEVLQVFLLTEIYIFRQAMCNIRTNSYNTFLHHCTEPSKNSITASHTSNALNSYCSINHFQVMPIFSEISQKECFTVESQVINTPSTCSKDLRIATENK